MKWRVRQWARTPFPLVPHGGGSVLAVKGSLRRFAPWTAPGRSEGRRCSRGERGWMGRIVRRALVHNAKQVTGQHDHFGGLG